MKKLFPIIFLTLLILGLGCPNPDVEECLRDLKSHNLVIKGEAIYRIGELKITEAIPDLVSLLNQDSDEISADIIEALGKIGDSAAVEPLIARLNEDNPLIREKAIEALGKIRDKRAVPALASILEQKDSRSDREVFTAIWALGNIGERSAEPILNSLLKGDNNKYIRYNVEQALKRIPTAETESIETSHQPQKDKIPQTEETTQSPKSNEENVNNNKLSPQLRQLSKPKIMKKEERTPSNDANIPGTKSIKRPPTRAKSKKLAKTELSQSREEKAKTGKPTSKD